jgi:hypothetical protein
MKRRFFVTGLVGLATLPLVACNSAVSDKTLGRLKFLSARLTEAAVKWGTGVAPELVAQISENNTAIQALENGVTWRTVGKGAIERLVASAALLIPLLPLPATITAPLSIILAAINGVLPMLAGTTIDGVAVGVATLEQGEAADKELNLYVVGLRKLR